MQAFKENDEKERKVVDAGLLGLGVLSASLDKFYLNAYTSYPLGDVFIRLGNSPLSRAIPAEAFRTGFFAIHELFSRPGTFEFYLTVFRAIFGQGAQINFSIPGPGQLLIEIEVLQALLENFSARYISDNKYFYDDIIDQNGDFIVFQGSQGIKTQNEVDALVHELYPAGVFVEADLTIN